MERLDVVCKCGKLLKQVTPNCSGGTMVCPSCRKRVRYDVSDKKVHTSYIK